MRPRFLAIIADDATLRERLGRQVERATAFRKAFDTENLTLFLENGAAVINLDDALGVVVGTVFSGDTAPTKIGAFEASATRVISETRGAYLTTAYWGAYVAFLSHPGSDSIAVLRDPLGMLPCYYFENGDATIVCSDVDPAVSAGLIGPEIDWPRVGRRLRANGLRTPETCIVGLTELLPGFRLTVKPNGNILDQCWSPWSYVDASVVHDDQEIAERLGATIRGCVRAWASCFDRALIGISGGLDSSIVAASLAEAGLPFECLTMATSVADGDERAYARMLANALDVRLTEAFYQRRHIDIDHSISADLPRPHGMTFTQSLNRTLTEVAAAGKADVIFTGVGGDCVFCYLTSATPILDRYRAEGFGRGVLQSIDDICGLAGCSVWAASRMAFKRSLSGPKYHWRRETRLLPAEVAGLSQHELTHPWLDAPPDALPGKAVHIGMILRALNIVDSAPRGAAPPSIHPLLSQPVVEMCLSIPTWKWCAGGRNRSIARQAFATALPAGILSRTSKGGPDAFCIEVIDDNRAALMERLGTGLLNEHGLIDTPTILGILSNPTVLRPPDHARLSALAETEAWLRAWSEKRQRAGIAGSIEIAAMA